MRIEWIEKYLAEAEQLFYMNRAEEGLTLLNNLLYEEPGYGSLHNHLGWAYLYYTQDAARAELHLRMAIRFDETQAAPYLHLGNLCIRQGQYAAALAWLENGVTKQGANKPAFYESMAQAFELKKDFRNAIRAYKSAAFASVAGFETNTYFEGIRRCRKKRLAMLFAF
jgi:predicted Zn-dependent protease